MKGVKKLLIVLFLVTSIFIVTGCKKNNNTVKNSNETKGINIAGKYELTSIDSSEEKYTSEDIENIKELGYEVSLELKTDKRGVLNIFGEVQNVTYDAKYIYTDDDKIPFTFKKNVLKMMSDKNTLIFKKAE